MVRKITKKTTNNNKDFIFKVILSALLTASVAINGIMAYNTSKIAKNTENPAQVIVKPVLIHNEIKYETTPFVSELAPINTNEIMDGIYIIESGDRLSELVNNWYGKYDYKLLMAFAKYNNIKNVDKIYTGDLVYVPTVEKLNEIIAENNGFAVKPQTKPSVVEKSNETKVVVNELKSVLNETKPVVNETKAVSTETKKDTTSLNEKVEENTKSISTLDTKVAENTESIEALKNKVNIHQELFDFYEGEIRPDATEISSIKSDIIKNSENIDVMDEKLDAHSTLEAEEINKIDERLTTLEQSWVNGSLTIDEVLQRMSNLEQAIKDLSNNNISKEEAMSIIDYSDKISEDVIQEENKHYEKINDEYKNAFSDEIKEPKLERIPEEEVNLPSDEIQSPKSEFIPKEDVILPSEEVMEVKAERIPDEETKIPSDDIDTLPTEEKITDVELPYIETESEKEEIPQPQNNKEKMVLPPANQKFIDILPESIIAYTKTR